MPATRKSTYKTPDGRRFPTTEYNLYNYLKKQGATWQHWSEFCLFLDKNAPEGFLDMYPARQNPNAPHSTENTIFLPKKLKSWVNSVDTFDSLEEYQKPRVRANILDMGKLFLDRGDLTTRMVRFVENIINDFK